MKTNKQQITAILHHCKSFELAANEKDYVLFFGTLKPIESSYRVSLEFGNRTGFRFPIVKVLSPKLILNFNAAEEAPLPHVYFDKKDLTLSPLCLFDPAQNEWSNKQLIATSILYWALDWLACYEGWQATGKWSGGGRHAKPIITRDM